MTRNSFTSGSSRPVDLEAIERELGRLWKEATASPSADGETVTRTCLLTLLVLKGPDARASQVQADLAAVFRARPCRILMLEVDTRLEGDSVNAFISAHCVRPSGGERQVCCEQVTLVCPAAATEHLPALAQALAVSDLPVVLYLPGEPEGDPDLLDRLCAASDKVVYDSGGMSPARAARASRRAGSSSRTAVADLEWGRTAPHRVSLAGLFDSALLRPLLDQVTGVTTTGGPGSTPGGSLLHGWVRASLGDRSLPAGHRESEDHSPGLVHGLCLDAGEGSRIIVERGQAPEILVARAEMPRTCPLPACRRFPCKSRAELLCDEIDRSGQDPVFARAVEMSSAGPETGSETRG